MIKKNKAGFTLAEILLTMTIVGVVAAMTIPTLHYNRVKKNTPQNSKTSTVK